VGVGIGGTSELVVVVVVAAGALFNSTSDVKILALEDSWDKWVYFLIIELAVRANKTPNSTTIATDCLIIYQ